MKSKTLSQPMKSFPEVMKTRAMKSAQEKSMKVRVAMQEVSQEKSMKVRVAMQEVSQQKPMKVRAEVSQQKPMKVRAALQEVSQKKPRKVRAMKEAKAEPRRRAMKEPTRKPRVKSEIVKSMKTSARVKRELRVKTEPILVNGRSRLKDTAGALTFALHHRVTQCGRIKNAPDDTPRSDATTPRIAPLSQLTRTPRRVTPRKAQLGMPIPASSSSAPADDTNMVQEILKGCNIPVDDFVPNSGNFRVYKDADGIWGCMLHQPNIGANNNKFYLIQILENEDEGSYVVWSRWGRIGCVGQNHTLRCSSIGHAKCELQTKFQAKTGIAWDRRANARPKAGKYAMIEMYYQDPDSPLDETQARIKFSIELTDEAVRNVLAALDENNPDTLKEDVVLHKASVPVVTKGSRILAPTVDELRNSFTPCTFSVQFDRPSEEQPSTLHRQLQDALRIICDFSMITQSLVRCGVDGNKVCLAGVNSKIIGDAYEKLDDISFELANNRQFEQERLSREFFAIIPHDVANISDLIINSEEKLMNAVLLVDSFREIEIAHRLVKRPHNTKIKNSLDYYYESFGCDLMVLHPTSAEFKMVETYAHNTHGSSHSQYKLKLRNLFTIQKMPGNKFDHKNSPNRQLLWYGTRLSNWVGILTEGLRMPSPDAPDSPYKFGKGIYFSDCVSNSANLCLPLPDCNRGFMLLCEVALGEMNERLYPDSNASKLPIGKLSTKGLGRIAPSTSDMTKTGLNVPLGKIDETRVRNATLLYNEYVVYSTDQIRPVYLCDFEFIFDQNPFARV